MKEPCDESGAWPLALEILSEGATVGPANVTADFLRSSCTSDARYELRFDRSAELIIDCPPASTGVFGLTCDEASVAPGGARVGGGAEVFVLERVRAAEDIVASSL